jgi:hypothetical protein
MVPKDIRNGLTIGSETGNISKLSIDKIISSSLDISPLTYNLPHIVEETNIGLNSAIIVWQRQLLIWDVNIIVRKVEANGSPTKPTTDV